MNDSGASKSASPENADRTVLAQASPSGRSSSLDLLITEMKSRRARQREVGEHAEASEFDVVTELTNQLECRAPEELDLIVLHRASEYLGWRKQELERLLRARGSTMDYATSMEAEDLVGEATAPRSNREAFVRAQDRLLSECRGMYVAFAQGRLVAACAAFEDLMAQVQALHPSIDVYIDRVEEPAFHDPPVIEMGGLHEVCDLGEMAP